jgi:hypothetical protein
MDTALLIAVRLAREGFGTTEQILNQPTPLVLASLEYCGFCADYEKAHIDLNKSH